MCYEPAEGAVCNVPCSGRLPQPRAAQCYALANLTFCTTTSAPQNAISSSHSTHCPQRDTTRLSVTLQCKDKHPGTDALTQNVFLCNVNAASLHCTVLQHAVPCSAYHAVPAVPDYSATLCSDSDMYPLNHRCTHPLSCIHLFELPSSKQRMGQCSFTSLCFYVAGQLSSLLLHDAQPGDVFQQVNDKFHLGLQLPPRPSNRN